MKQVKTAFYLLTSKTNAKGEAPIYIRIKHKGQAINLSTNIYLNPNDWDKKKSRVKVKHTRYYNLNKQMKNLEDNIFEILDNATGSAEAISLQKIKLMLRGKNNHVVSLVALVDYFINYIEHSRNYSKGRVNHYKSFKNKLIHFLSHKYSILDFKLENLNYEFIIEFESFLSAEYKNGVNTVTSNIKRLKAIVNAGIRLGWLKADPFKNYKCKFETSTRQFLTHHELQKIQSLILPEDKCISVVRDMFLFMAYTGISYGDVYKLTDSNIIDFEGDQLICFKRGKTNVESKILLLPEARVLIEKYRHSPACKKRSNLLPVPSNKTMNDSLKLIAKKAGITKNLSCHVGRHTFATLSLENNVPIETLSKALGHSSIKTTQLYGKITEVKICRDYSRMNGVFSY